MGKKSVFGILIQDAKEEGAATVTFYKKNGNVNVYKMRKKCLPFGRFLYVECKEPLLTDAELQEVRRILESGSVESVTRRVADNLKEWSTTL